MGCSVLTAIGPDNGLAAAVFNAAGADDTIGVAVAAAGAALATGAGAGVTGAAFGSLYY